MAETPGYPARAHVWPDWLVANSRGCRRRCRRRRSPGVEPRDRARTSCGFAECCQARACARRTAFAASARAHCRLQQSARDRPNARGNDFSDTSSFRGPSCPRCRGKCRRVGDRLDRHAGDRLPQPRSSSSSARAWDPGGGGALPASVSSSTRSATPVRVNTSPGSVKQPTISVNARKRLRSLASTRRETVRAHLRRLVGGCQRQLHGPRAAPRSPRAGRDRPRLLPRYHGT